ncbi:hypothetical protein BDQ12DRAFT_738417 [Crucibulum laeve]|uniref:Uncharacterized protein n=1 Tax=Crucibulum laeve TaxID=68775 RepID=A0A5C3LPW0_9AGAR|nr:hypothetical protein BDQ12DRAFT_738417 [Crucibulum laeve]
MPTHALHSPLLGSREEVFDVGHETDSESLSRYSPAPDIDAQGGWNEVANAIVSLREANIKPSIMSLKQEKLDQLKTLGLLTHGGAIHFSMLLETTTTLISLVRQRVSCSTLPGWRALVDLLLLHVTSNKTSDETMLLIIPKFQVLGTHDCIDALFVESSQKLSSFVRDDPGLAFANQKLWEFIRCPVFIANECDIHNTLHHAFLKTADLCRVYDIPILRGCVSNGEEWVFFVYIRNDDGTEGGNVFVTEHLQLQQDLGGLPRVLGLLYDWVDHAREKDSPFCNFYPI